MWKERYSELSSLNIITAVCASSCKPLPVGKRDFVPPLCMRHCLFQALSVASKILEHSFKTLLLLGLEACVIFSFAFCCATPLGQQRCCSWWIWESDPPHQRFCFTLVSREWGLRWVTSEWAFVKSPEVESCCSTSGICYEVVPLGWKMVFSLFGFFLRNRTKLSPKSKCILP